MSKAIPLPADWTINHSKAFLFISTSVIVGEGEDYNAILPEVKKLGLSDTDALIVLGEALIYYQENVDARTLEDAITFRAFDLKAELSDQELNTIMDNLMNVAHLEVTEDKRIFLTAIASIWKLDSMSGRINYLSARTKFRVGEREGARKDLERGSLYDDGTYGFLRAALLSEMGQVADALLVYNDEITKMRLKNSDKLNVGETEDLISLHNNRAKLRVQAGDYQGAIHDYTQIIELEAGSGYDPDSDWYRARGEVKKLIGNNDSAMNDFNKADEIDE